MRNAKIVWTTRSSALVTGPVRTLTWSPVSGSVGIAPGRLVHRGRFRQAWDSGTGGTDLAGTSVARVTAAVPLSTVRRLASSDEGRRGEVAGGGRHRPSVPAPTGACGSERP